MKNLLLAIYRYRHFIRSSVLNDLKSRFARSRLGALWMILQPLAQVAIFAMVLSELLAARLPGIDNKYAFAIYLTSGLMAWSFFVEIVSRCLTVFVDNGNLLKKISFPRICLPIIVAGSALVNNVLLFLAILLVFVLLNHWPGSSLIWLPALVLLTLVFGVGLGLFLGIVNVFVRDINQVMTVLLQLWFWLTPIVYPANVLPAQFRYLLEINPMTPLVAGYQNILLLDQAPDWRGLVWVAVLSVGLLVASFVLFRRASPEMVDVL